MKALSIRQPWTWLILNAGKDIENRDWSTLFRGPVLIHASKGMTNMEYDDAMETAYQILGANFKAPSYNSLERGGFVGKMEIVDCVKGHASPWFFGKYGFVIRNAQPIAFHPFRGALGFFDTDFLKLAQKGPA